MARKRNKIKFCYEDYMANISDEEKSGYQQRFHELIEIIGRADDDREVMALAKEHDAVHNSGLFDEAVHLTMYCIACHKMDCDC